MVRASKRVRIMGLILLSLLGLFVYRGVWPFLIGGPRMRSFCEALPTGITTVDLRARAADHGYDVVVDAHPEVPGMVFDRRAMGRFQCQLVLRQDRLVSSRYTAVD